MKSLSEEAILVRNTLMSLGIETPMLAESLRVEERLEIISMAIKEVMQALSLDISDDSLCETPQRIAQMFVHEIFSGLDYENFPKITTIENKMDVDEEVLVKDVSFSSTCEHHFVVFDGKATVGYIPNNKVIGLSKINRLVRFFAQRPQVQERLTAQIFFALKALLETEHVYVKLEAAHYCVKGRGVQDLNSMTTTIKSGGDFKTRR